MKKLFALIIVGLFLISFASATIKQYDSNEQKVTLKNNLLFVPTSTIGEITLLTPLEYEVSPGYQMIAEMKVEGFKDYNDFIRQIEFYDLKKGMSSINRDFDLKKKEIRNIEVDDYENIITGYLKNGSAIYSYEKIGSHFEDKVFWTDIKNSDFKKGSNFNVGIFTEVQINDKVEWIPTVSNVKIEEWASWVSYLDTRLQVYYKLNESSGNVKDSVGTLNLSTHGTPLYSQTGIIGTAVGFDSNSDRFTNLSSGISSLQFGTGDFSVNMWVKSTEAGADKRINIGFSSTWTYSEYYSITWDSGTIFSRIATTGGGVSFASGSTYNDGNYHMLTLIRNESGTKLSLFVDGVQDGFSTGAAQTVNIGTLILGDERNTTFTSTTIDEFSIWNRSLNSTEIAVLYNGGNGISYGDFGATVSLNSPIDYYNSSSRGITFNATVNEGLGKTLVNVSLIIDNVYNETNTTSINGFHTFTKNFADGTRTWKIEVCDTGSCINSSSRNFTIDGTSPTISIESPNETFNYLYQNYNLTLNFTPIDYTSGLSVCNWEYNSSNSSVSCSNNTKRTYYFPYESNINNGTIFVNDTFGNMHSPTISWDYKIFQNSINYSQSTLEGSLENIILNLSLSSGNSVSSISLNYNGTNYSSSVASNGFVIASNQVSVPDVSSSGNITFFWFITLSSGSVITSNVYNQTVNILDIDNCSSYSNLVYNYTVYDEEMQNKLQNTSIEIDINLYNELKTLQLLNFSKEYNKVNPATVCLNVPLASTTKYLVDSVVKYSANESDSIYAIEYYNLLNSTLSNSTDTTISLYDLLETDSTVFKITFRGSDFSPVENALIYIDRQYVSEGIFKTVELPKTDSEGQTVAHLVRDDVVYNIRVLKNNEVLGNFENKIAFCEDYTIGNCELSLDAASSTETTFNYNEQLGIIFSDLPEYNNQTNIISFSFSSTSGNEKSLFMEVERNDIFGNQTLCNHSLTSASGTLSCSIDPNIDDSKIKVSVYVDELVIIKYIELDNSGYGSIGYIAWFFLTIILILAFGDDKTKVMVGMALSYAGAIALGISKGDIIGIGSAGIWILVSTILGIWKVNKEKPQ